MKTSILCIFTCPEFQWFIKQDRKLHFPPRTADLVIDGQRWKIYNRQQIDAAASYATITGLIVKDHNYFDICRNNNALSINNYSESLCPVRHQTRNQEMVSSHLKPENRLDDPGPLILSLNPPSQAWAKRRFLSQPKDQHNPSGKSRSWTCEKTSGRKKNSSASISWIACQQMQILYWKIIFMHKL